MPKLTTRPGFFTSPSAVKCLPFILTLAASAAHAGVIDTFDVSHDYSGGNVAGTIWNGMLNADHLVSGDASITNAGRLTLVPTDFSGWEGGGSDAPTLYVLVDGDFDASVQVAAMSTGDYSDGGLIARVPDLADAGPGEDWLTMNYFGASGFDHARSVDDTTPADFAFSPLRPFLRMTRSGNTFAFYSKTTAGDAWDLRDTLERPDFAGVTTLQVGLQFGTFFVNPGSVQFDNFMLNADPVPEPASAMLGLLGLALLAARRR